jgi:hypothetical protein
MGNFIMCQMLNLDDYWLLLITFYFQIRLIDQIIKLDNVELYNCIIEKVEQS